MEQLVLDIHSKHDADLIKELLKKFKNVDVLSFSSNLSSKETKQRIAEGINDANSGNVKSWKTVKAKLSKKIQSHGK